MVRRLLSSLTLALLSSALAFSPTPPDPERGMQDFLKAYWDPELRYFLAWNRNLPIPRLSGAGPMGGKYSDFWWEAQLWDVVMDAYQRAPSPQGRALIDAVYDGFVAQYPDWANDFNDDLGWWAQGATRAYTLTQDPRYLARARTLFEDIWKYWTPSYGGGVLWRRSGDTQKNVATNGPLAVVAVRLYQASRDPRDLERARQLWEFVEQKLTDGDAQVFDHWTGPEPGELRRWDFTYNFGNFILASLALNEVAPDPRLLERSVKAADWTLANLSNDGILLDEGIGDGGGFKGVFVRALRRLIDTPALEDGARARYRAALRDNATQVWNARRPDGLTGPNWSALGPPGAIESLAAASGLAALQLAALGSEAPLEARIPGGTGRYEAENSPREGVTSSVTAPGYTGRAYLNGFFRSGQFVNFEVNVPTPGRYTLRFRYSAGGGAAVRSLGLSQQPKNPLDTSPDPVQGAPLVFARTADWFTWAERAVPLELKAGYNRVSLRFEAGTGKNWLNLDHLTLSPPGGQP